MSNTKEKISENAVAAATALERTVNSFDCSVNAEYIVDKMCYMHRTLNQAFTGGIIITFIRKMAKMYESGSYDPRNESACKACRVMWDAIKAEYGIDDDSADFRMPMI